jgi:hypothetical protein
LTGLATAYSRTGDKNAAITKTKANKAFERSDIKNPQPVF